MDFWVKLKPEGTKSNPSPNFRFNYINNLELNFLSSDSIFSEKKIGISSFIILFGFNLNECSSSYEIYFLPYISFSVFYLVHF